MSHFGPEYQTKLNPYFIYFFNTLRYFLINSLRSTWFDPMCFWFGWKKKRVTPKVYGPPTRPLVLRFCLMTEQEVALCNTSTQGNQLNIKERKNIKEKKKLEEEPWVTKYVWRRKINRRILKTTISINTVKVSILYTHSIRLTPALEATDGQQINIINTFKLPIQILN